MSEHGSLLASDIRNGLLQYESHTNTFKDPLSSVNALHTSQTDTSQSIPIIPRSSYTKYEERISAFKKRNMITLNEVEHLLVLKC